MSTNLICVAATVIFYLSVMVIIGIVYSRKNKNTDDFYLGGRRLGPLVTAMSAEASDMSGWLLMGLPGVALATGLPEATWTAIGLAIGTYLNWLFVAKRLRVYTQKLQAITLPDFFSRRFGDSKNHLTLIAAIIIAVFFVPYTASGFAACGKLFHSIFGWDYIYSMIASAIVIIIYCVMGGFLAASTTDFLQSIIMTVALITVAGFAEGCAKGFGNIFDHVSSIEGFLSITKGFDVTTNSPLSYGALPIASTLAWGLGYFGMPHILLRFMSIENKEKLKISRRVASIWVVISMGIAVIIGISGTYLMNNGILPSYVSSSASETVIIDIARLFLNYGIIPSVVAGIIIAGILASTMSTSDSQLLTAASAVSQNLIQEFFKVKLSEKKSIIIARVSVVIISVIAIFLALDPNASVFRIVSFAWAGFGASFGPVVLVALFWKRATKPGILAGMISGCAMIFIWKFVIRTAFAGTWLDIYELLPSFILNLVIIVVVSLITKAPDKSIVKTYDEVLKEL